MLSKIIGSSIAIAAALAFSASTIQAQNLLVNGDFEYSGLNIGDGVDHGTPPPVPPNTAPAANPAGGGAFTPNPINSVNGGLNQGWALYGASGVTNMANSFDSPASGFMALLTRNNTWGGAGGYQQVAPVGGVIAGATYTFSISALTDNGLNPNYSTPIELILTFLGPPIGTNLVYSTIASPSQSAQDGQFAFQPGVDTWSPLSVWAVAPAGAIGINIQPQTINGNPPTGFVPQIYFDNAALTVAVPEPASLALVGLGLASFYFIRRRKS